MLHLGLELKELRGSIEHAGRAKLEELQVFRLGPVCRLALPSQKNV